jgi:hypothetical protein
MHHGGGSTRQLSDAMLLELFKSRARYFERHASAASRLTYKPLLALAAAWNALYALTGRVPRDRGRLAWAIAATAWRR